MLMNQPVVTMRRLLVRGYALGAMFIAVQDRSKAKLYPMVVIAAMSGIGVVAKIVLVVCVAVSERVE